MLNKNPISYSELFGYAHYSYTTASAGCGVPRMNVLHVSPANPAAENLSVTHQFGRWQ